MVFVLCSSSNFACSSQLPLSHFPSFPFFFFLLFSPFFGGGWGFFCVFKLTSLYSFIHSFFSLLPFLLLPSFSSLPPFFSSLPPFSSLLPPPSPLSLFSLSTSFFYLPLFLSSLSLFLSFKHISFILFLFSFSGQSLKASKPQKRGEKRKDFFFFRKFGICKVSIYLYIGTCLR